MMGQFASCVLQKSSGSTDSLKAYSWYSTNSAASWLTACREQGTAYKSVRLEAILFSRDDLQAIPKQIVCISQVIHNILLHTAAPLLGYSAVVPPKCMNGVTALLLVNYVTQSVNFPTETCH